ncbi:Smr/MutS family protein [Luteimonas sp. SX5]|uniref:Smr/MutS family protein n=1 Tax=Luteimonas galliterrae TaxID=2940486 RepID=A0ABT0MH18_9GAMM|nr:Smr/MutS family protein [Luteimonas galliterrae]MCL1634171.1 Smr/MutS family protein [Luteimonas galliterrae]
MAKDDRNPDDSELFRQAIGPVRELPAAAPPPAKPKPRARAAMAERDESEALGEFRRAMAQDDLEAGDALSYRRDEVPPRVLQRLRRGLYAAQDELDLHHSDAQAAETLLRAFLQHARQSGLGCVRIIHGKGLNSDSAIPVLKNLVDRVLRHRADVLAFHSAPAAQGGTGAVLVLLAKR